MADSSSPPAIEAVPPPDEPRPLLARVAGALTHRNFRLVWFAALGSTIGTWMQNFAQSWLVFDLTGSNFYKGVDDFLGQLPILLFMLIGGVIADRHDRRKLLTGSQYVQATSAFILAFLLYRHHVTIGDIFALSFLTGCGQAFGGPAYQSMIPSLVPRRDLPNAIALNSTQFNLSRVLGPLAGTVVLVGIGAAACFALNGVSFFFVVIALAMLRLPPHQPSPERKALGQELRSGLSYVRENRVMLTLTALVFMSTFLVMPVLTLLPGFATNVFANGAADMTRLARHAHLPAVAAGVLTSLGSTGAIRLSTLMACQGLGAIIGALVIGSFGRFRHMGTVLLAVQVVLGVLVAGFASSGTFPFSLLLIFISGMFNMVLFSISFSLVQLTVPDALRGRVVSIYMVALRGGWPLGGLVAGKLADVFTAPHVLATNGLLLSALAAGLLLSGRGRSLRAI